MKSFLKASLFLATLAVAATAPALRAEGEKPAGEKKAHGDALAGLNLTEAQQKQVAAIRAEAKTQTEALAKDDKEGRTKVRKETDAKIRAVLTPEQQAKYDETHAKGGKKEKKAE